MKRCILVVCVLTVLSGSTSGGPPEGTSGHTHLYLPIPNSITIEDWRLFTDLLGLDEEQVLGVERVYASYRDRDSALRAGAERELWARSSALAVQQQAGPSVQFSTELNQLLEDAGEFAERLAENDQLLFNEVAALLDDLDPLAVERARLLRERMTLETQQCQFPVREVDVTELALRLEIDLTRDAHDVEAVEAQLMQYDQSRTVLARRHHRRLTKALRDCSLLSARTLEGESFLSDEAEQGELWNEYLVEAAKINKPWFEACVRLKELNDRHLEALRVLAANEPAEELIDAYRRRAFPTVFPDAASLGDFFDDVVTDETISAPERKELRALEAEYVAQHESLSKKMVEHFIESRKQLCLTWTVGASMREWESRYVQVWQRRIELSEDTIMLLRSTLNQDVLDKCGSKLIAVEANITRLHNTGPRGMLVFKGPRSE